MGLEFEYYIVDFSQLFQNRYGIMDDVASDAFREKCDNLLVEAENIYRFRGLVLYNAKHPQFYFF